jgi:protein-tyrosine phosphatase
VIDLHAHILPGFDDGVRSIEEARALAAAAAREGVTAIAATPHVRDDYPTRAERMERAVAILNADFRSEGIDVEVVRGGEVALERLWQLDDDEIRRFTFGGHGRWILLEFPYGGWPPLLERTVETLRASGIETLLAHPERNAEVQADPVRLAPLVDAGLRVQVTAASLAGRLGQRPREAAERLLAAGLVHVLASDAHGPHIDRGGLAAGAAALGDAALARRLTVETPTEIVRSSAAVASA